LASDFKVVKDQQENDASLVEIEEGIQTSISISKMN
jgi:hypothetical protein